jgi:hypothetical protein
MVHGQPGWGHTTPDDASIAQGAPVAARTLTRRRSSRHPVRPGREPNRFVSRRMRFEQNASGQRIRIAFIAPSTELQKMYA